MAGLTFSSAPVARVRELLRSSSARAAEGAFVVEGITLIDEAIDSGLDVHSIFVTQDSREYRSVGDRFVCATGVIERVSTTVAAQPMLAVVSIPDCDVPVNSSLIVWCEELNDPGNLGTIIRAAEAAGADAVALSGGSVDPWNPKVVRAAAGALFRLPVIRDVGCETLPGRLMATVMTGGQSMYEADLISKTVIMLGNEARGLSTASLRRSDGLITIPMSGPTESLNVAVAAALVVFEAARQRREFVAPTE